MIDQEQTAFEPSFLRGISLDDCFLVLHSTSTDQNGVYHWKLLHIVQGVSELIFSGEGHVKDIWVSPTNVIYLTAAHDNFIGLAVGHPTNSGYTWTWEEAVGTCYTHPEHVWGLSDDFVLVCGGGILNADHYPDPATRPSIDEPYCWIKRSSGWKCYPSSGWVTQIHGQDEASLYATGHAGLTAHWTGAAWEELPAAETEIIHLQVTPEREIYGTSSFGNILNYSESSGWKMFVSYVGHCTGFVYWHGALYLLREDGLYTIKGRLLELVQPASKPKQLVAGQGLLWHDEHGLHEWTPSGLRSFELLLPRRRLASV